MGQYGVRRAVRGSGAAIAKVVAHFAELMRTHTTSTFDGDAILFRATENAQDFLDPDAWRGHEQEVPADRLRHSTSGHDPARRTRPDRAGRQR